MGTVWNSIPRFSASSLASSKLSFEENLDGMNTPRTLSLPRASTAKQAVSEESIPPDSPITTFSKPFFLT